jgi:hypothetical protein
VSEAEVDECLATFEAALGAVVAADTAAALEK